MVQRGSGPDSLASEPTLSHSAEVRFRYSLWKDGLCPLRFQFNISKNYSNRRLKVERVVSSGGDFSVHI